MTPHHARQDWYSIRIGDRWFYAMRKGRVLTAHSMLGAKMWSENPHCRAEAAVMQLLLRSKGKDAVIERIAAMVQS